MTQISPEMIADRLSLCEQELERLSTFIRDYRHPPNETQLLAALAFRGISLWIAFRECLRGTVPAVATTLLRPLVEACLAAHYIANDEDRRILLWEAEQIRQDLARGGPNGADILSADDIAHLNARIASARQGADGDPTDGYAPGSTPIFPGASRIAHLPEFKDTVIEQMYTLMYRAMSSRVHVGLAAMHPQRRFDPHADGGQTMHERLSEEDALFERLCAVLALALLLTCIYEVGEMFDLARASINVHDRASRLYDDEHWSFDPTHA